MTPEKIVETVTAAITGGAAALVGLWAFAQRVIDAKVDAMKAKEIAAFKGELNAELERFKAEANKDLERVKHALQLEYAQKQIVLETQRPCFEAVLAAMQSAIRQSGESLDNGKYQPIDARLVGSFVRATGSQSLLIPFAGAHGIRLFTLCLSDAADHSELGASKPSADTVCRSIIWLVFLQERMVDYFQSLVGLPVTGEPLRDLDILSACRMLNSHDDAENGWPTRTVAKNDSRVPKQLIDDVLAQLPVLLDEVERLAQYLRRHPRKNVLYDDLVEADRLLERLREWKAKSQ